MDLSRIPEPLRTQLREQLEKLPAEYRGPLEAKLAKMPVDKLEEVLAKTVPMLERLAKKTSSAGKPSNSAQKSAGTVVGQRVGLEPTYQRNYDPHDHYNTTIQRGDRQGPSLIVIFVIAGLLLLLLQALGWLSGAE